MDYAGYVVVVVIHFLCVFMSFSHRKVSRVLGFPCGHFLPVVEFLFVYKHSLGVHYTAIKFR